MHSCQSRTFIKVLTLLLGCFLSLPADGHIINPSGKERVLVLNSYHQGYTWGDNEVAGLLASFAASDIKADLEIEYLDTKHMPEQEHFPQLLELFRVKLAHQPTDLILTMDDPAFEFAISNRKKLFAGIPIVFIGVNDFNPTMLKGEENVTGAVERQDFRGTVEAALALQPKTREVVVVHDYSSTGLATKSEVLEQLAPLLGRISVRTLPESSIDEVVAAVGGLRPGSIVLAVSFGVDKAGKVFNHGELAKILSEKSSVPVYSTKVERLGHGIVGGSLMDGRTHGFQGGDLALEVLTQGSAAGVPIIQKPRSELMFDYQQLVRFKIPLKNLPPGSKLINKSQSFYSQHSLVINISTLVIGLLTASLFSVIVANQRRFRAEEELYEIKSYQTLFENASDPLFLIDSHGHILESSSAAQTLLQMTAADLKNHLITEIINEEASKSFQSSLMSENQHGRGQLITEFILPNKDKVPVEISSRKITYRGQEVIFCAARDISQRIRYEEKLRELNAELEQRIKSRTLELEISNRDLASFCYAISHELCAPVARIVGLSQVLQEDLVENPATAEHCAKRITVAGGELQRVIDSVLRLSRLAQSSFEPRLINLSALVREIMNSMIAEIPERQVQVVIADDLTATVDPSLVRLCLENLLGNALKYTSRQPLARIEFGMDTSKGAFFIKDNGIGFDMAQANKVFEPFARLHTEDEFAGDGIGLATVQRIIERHGGRIWADASPGHGAVFYFTLNSSNGNRHDT